MIAKSLILATLSQLWRNLVMNILENPKLIHILHLYSFICFQPENT